MAQIGIKLADGSFYALFDDNGARRKRVVLTPAKADQKVARVELLRQDGIETHHLGQLTLDDLHGSNSDLELVVGLDIDGNLDASVGDPSSGEYQSFAVNVYQLDDIDTVSLDAVSLDDAEEFGVAEVTDAEIEASDTVGADSDDDIGLPDFDDDDIAFTETVTPVPEDTVASLDEEPLAFDDMPLESTDADEAFSLDDMPSLDDSAAGLQEATVAMDDDPLSFDDDSAVSEPGPVDSELSIADDLPMPDFEDELDSEPDIGSDLAGLESETEYRPDADEEIFEEGVEPRPFHPVVLGALLVIGIGVAAVAAFGVYLWLSDQWPALRAAVFLPMAVGRFGLRRRDR